MMSLLNSAQVLEWIQKTLALISLKKKLPSLDMFNVF